MIRWLMVALVLSATWTGFRGDTGVRAQSSDAAIVRDASGVEAARVTIDEIVEPFDLYDPSDPPVHGYHYLLATITIENTGQRPFPFKPESVVPRDVDGFLYGDDSIRRAEDVAPPDLERQELAAGGHVTGVIGFQILSGAILADILMFAEGGQLVTLADSGVATPVELGDEIEIAGTDGPAIATVAVTGLTDPFEAYDPDSPPDRGSHYVMLSMSAVNPGPREFRLDPSTVYLQDSDGFLYAAQRVRVPDDGAPELERQDMEAGAAASGTIGYLVLDGVTIERIVYQPAGDRLVVLADLTGGGGSTSPGDATVTTAEIDCVAIDSWLRTVQPEAAAVFPVVGMLMSMRVSEDPEYVQTAHQVADAFLLAAEGFRAIEAPDEVADLNARLADAFEIYGTALEELATAIEEEDQAAIDAAGQALYDAEPALIIATGEVEELASGCGIESGD